MRDSQIRDLQEKSLQQMQQEAIFDGVVSAIEEGTYYSKAEKSAVQRSLSEVLFGLASKTASTTDSPKVHNF